MNIHSQKAEFVQRNASLFWWMKPEDVVDLGIDSIVETILNYGDESDVKEMIEIYGLDATAQVFYRNINKKRDNYLPLTKHFFKLYFKRHAPQYFI